MNISALVSEYKKQRPEAIINSEPFHLQGTNSIVYKGTYKEIPAIFKFSLRNSVEREIYGYFYLAKTMCISQMLDSYKDKVIVTSFIDGNSIQNLLTSQNDITEYQVNLVQLALQSILNNLTPIDNTRFSFINDYFQTINKVYNNYRYDLFRDQIFKQTVEIISCNLNAFLNSDTTTCYLNDIGESNIIIQKDNLKAIIIDLEEVWPGNQLLQYGVVAVYGNYTESKLLKQMIKDLLEKSKYLTDEIFAAACIKEWMHIVSYNGWLGWKTLTDYQLDLTEDKIKQVNYYKNKLTDIWHFLYNTGK